VPDLVRYYLGEERLLPNVDAYLLEDPDQRGYVFEPDQLVLKRADGSGGHGLVIGPQGSDAELARRARPVSRPSRSAATAAVPTAGAAPGRSPALQGRAERTC
jgi:uncharacterized circularly permuted ATP-grasp superfamily protein